MLKLTLMVFIQAALAGAQLKTKLTLIGGDRRLIKGIVTLACDSSTAASKTKPERIACPDGPTPDNFCLSTANDGPGTAITIGVVTAQDPGDPYYVELTQKT